MATEPARFDVVVVGAGPAGIAAAYLLARQGVEVLLIERGPYPGSKNTFGGALYRHATAEIIPEFWKDAPIERKIVEKAYWLMTEDSAVKVGHRSKRFGVEPYNSFTVLRAKFDKWFADKAREAGVAMITGTTVVDAIVKDGRVRGVRTDREDGDVYADVVVAADGVNSLLSKKLGLHNEIPPTNVALGVKEIIQLPREKIMERFNLAGDEGADITLMGQVTRGMIGGGFIYTNSETLSVGVAATAADYVDKGISPVDLMEEFKAHPLIAPLLEGGIVKEYQAHLIPEGGFNSIPPLYADGYLVVGDAAALVNTVFFEGTNHALTSAKAAVDAILLARQDRDYSAKSLARYQKLLEESVTLKDLKAFRGVPGFFRGHPELFELYPRLINDAAHEFLSVDGTPKKEKQKAIMKMVTGQRSRWRLMKDLWEAWRAIA